MEHTEKGVIMASGHYKGCKLVASIDKESGKVCALEVQFKNAKPSRKLAELALAAWEPALAIYSYKVMKSLWSREWAMEVPFPIHIR